MCSAVPGHLRYYAILPSLGIVAGHFDCMHFINASVGTSGGEFGLIHLQAVLLWHLIGVALGLQACHTGVLLNVLFAYAYMVVFRQPGHADVLKATAHGNDREVVYQNFNEQLDARALMNARRSCRERERKHI